ncbi:MAG: alpha/beta fold hydrolase [Acidimicrobiales bacterium]
MPTIRANGIDLYFERRGPEEAAGETARRLLFFNGSGATLATSGIVIKPFAARFDVVAHDQRGLGRTSIPPGPYTMADYAADAAALLDHVGWDSCRVVGISFGGMVAQEFAVTHPERVERLALLCTSPGGDLGASYPLHELAGLDDAERAAKLVEITDTRFTPKWLASHPDDQMLADFIAQRGRGASSPEVERGEVEQLDARRSLDVGDRLPRISCPTMVASGRYDGIAPVTNGEAIAARIHGAELRVYEGGHAFFVQDASALPEVLDFLAGPA